MVYCEKCGKEVEPSLESYNSASTEHLEVFAHNVIV